MNIGYIMQADAVDMSTISGPQLHISSIFEGFKQRGHTARLLALQKNRAQWTDDLIEWHAADNPLQTNPAFRLVESPTRFIQSRLQLPFFRFFDSVRFSEACVRTLKGFDILYQRDGTMSYGGLIASWRMNIPMVVEVNGDLIEEWNHLGLTFSTAQRLVVHCITRLHYRFASHIVTVGDTIKRRLIGRWKLDPNHISVVTNGAEINLFLRPGSTGNIREKYSIPKGPVIAFSGGFEPWHGVDLILQGFCRVSAERPDVTLLLAGDGRTRFESEKLAECLGIRGRTVFTGRIEHSEVARILSLADVAVIYHRASASEIVETPLKLFEYMAAGKAIIAPDVPNMRRVLKNQESALLVPPDDPVALADATVRLLEDSELRRRIGMRAQEEAITKHSWDRAVRDLELIFGELIHKDR